MVQSAKTFRIFVSSTFSDLKEERNTLQKYVFPKLRELCAQHGFKFQPIDLRWGVSEEAGLDQQTMKICLEEIERSQRISPKPNFIVLLGNRYGWRPLSAEIEAEEFNKILGKVSADEEECLLWKDEQSEDKKGWYRLDENAVPAVYCLQPRTGNYVNYENWNSVEQKLHSILLKAASKLNLDEDDFLKYYASATEQEIVRGALKVEDAKDHVFCFFRKIENLPDDKDFVDIGPYRNVDEDAQEKLENLKKKLREQLPKSHIKEYNTEWTDEGISKDHLKDLCEEVYKALENIILEKIEEVEEIEPLDQEIEAHNEFGKDRAKFFTGRTEILNNITKYLENGNGSPLAIYGESGSGKSALMAKAIIDTKEKHSNVQIITRFISATPDSSDIRSLLESLCHQISRIYGESDSEVPLEYNDLINEFPEKLKLASPKKHLFIFLDALDQLSSADNAHSLNWLPDTLPNNVHIVVSSLVENFYNILKNKIPEGNLLKLEELAKEEGKDLLKLWLKDGKRTLQSEQWNEVIDKFHVEGLPLYLKLVFEEAKNWKSYTKTPKLKSDIPGIIKQMFDRLSHNSNHGTLIVDRSLGYLAASKNGLSEDEMIDILSRDKDIFYDFIYRARSEPTEILNAAKGVLKEDENELEEDSWALFEKLQKDRDFCFDVFDRMDKSKISFKLPVAIWSRLYFDLEPYLTERNADETSLLAFYHRHLGEVVAQEFLKEDVKIQRHRAFAKYFLDQDLKTEKDDERVYNVRKVSELPYQETYGELWGELEETLCDLRFIEGKCAVGMTYDLIEDYSIALDMHPEGHEEKKKRLKHEKRVDKYVEDLIAYSEGKIDHLDIIPSVKIWTEEEIRKDTERIINNPTGLENIKTFSKFVNSQIYEFIKFGHLHGFCLQQAHNFADSGLVTKAAESIINKNTKEKLILRDKNYRPKYNLHLPLLKTLDGHTSNVLAVAVTPDGKKAVSGGEDSTVRVWDLETGKQIHILEGHTKAVNAVAITSSGKKAVSGSSDNTIRLWNLETGKILKTLKRHTSSVDVVNVISDGKRTIKEYSDGSVIFIDEENDEVLGGNLDHVSAVAVTPDGKKVVSGNTDNTIHLWDLETGEILKTMEGHTGNIMSVAFTLDSKKVVSGSSDNTISLWDLETGKYLKLKGHTDEVNTIVVTPDGKRAVSGSKDMTVRIWDLQTGESKILEGQKDSLFALTITADCKKIITSKGIWDLETGKLLKTLKIEANVLAATPDGRTAISGDDNNVFVWDLETGSFLDTFEGHTNSINAIAVIANGKKAISKSNDNIMCLWNLKTGELIKKLKGHTDSVNKVVITADGKKVISGSSDNTIRLWDLETGELLNVLKGHTSFINAIAVTPDGKRAISGSGDMTVRIWDLQTGESKILEGEKDSLFVIDVAPDGRKAIGGIGDKTLRLWDLETGKLLKIFEGHTHIVKVVAFSANGKRIVSGSYDGTVLIWDLETGEILNTIKGYNNIINKTVNVVTVTHDGKKAIIGSHDYKGVDNNVFVWDLETGEILNTIKGHTDSINVVIVTPDNKKAITGSSDNTIRLWDLETGKQIFLSKENFPINSLAIKSSNSVIFGNSTGNVIVSHLLNINFSLPIITASRIWLFGKNGDLGSWNKNITANCQLCKNRFIVPTDIINRIKKIKRQYEKPNGWISDEAWEDPRLISECPYCNEKLKFNPFIVDNSKEEFEDYQDLDDFNGVKSETEDINAKSENEFQEYLEESLDTQINTEPEKHEIKEKPKKSRWKFWK